MHPGQLVEWRNAKGKLKRAPILHCGYRCRQKFGVALVVKLGNGHKKTFKSFPKDFSLVNEFHTVQDGR